MRRTRLVENREVFLAYALATCNFSTIQGLHHRFPHVWQRKDKYKYYRHVCLERPFFKEEYKLKFAYCLFEASTEDLAIFNVLFDELYKKYTHFYKQLKNGFSCYRVIRESELKEIVVKQTRHQQSDLVFLSVLDFFLEKLGVIIEKGNIFDNLKKDILRQERLYLEFEEESYHYLKQQLTKSNSVFLKRIKSFCRGYSDYLGENLVEFLNAKLDSFCRSSHNYKVMQWLRELGLWTQEVGYRLTQADVYQIVALLLCTDEDEEYQGEEDLICLGEFVLPMSIFTTFEQSLFELLPYFVMSQLMEENREFFLKTYHLKNQCIPKQLEKEVNRLKQELTQVKKSNVDLKSLLNEQKALVEKANKLKIKELESTLITTTKENDRLKQEVSELKEECATLKLLLKEESVPTPCLTELIVDEEPDIEKINCPEVMIVGGAMPTIQKLKRILPDCKYFEVDKRYNDQFFNGVRVAFLLTNVLNHGMTKKLDKHCPQIRKKSLSMTNVDLIIKEIAKQLHEW